ncbi:MAG: N-acetylglucosamine-6-phosphate deacetylase, partial [Candidatus Eremiobacteraeota bacterium]|nr:N-acetylglucosamine-6-phosphate deacetylase [Candidatus Eremiobacteraeota bacterium]
SYTLGPAHLALGTGEAIRGRVVVENGRIKDVLTADGPTDFRLPDGAIVAPGMIDVHTNGSGDVLFNRDQGNAIEVASQAYAAQGATGFVATVMTAPWESMLHAASEAAEVAHQMAESPETRGARCLGIHFEGPFLNPKFRRVHRHDWLLPATPDRARALLEACRGALAMVTMAPEVDGVDEVARFFFDQGIVCSAGHTSAKYRDGMLAIGLGFRTLTHAFNAMPPLDHREPSILAAFIADPRATVQVICDGFHVAPVMVDILYRTLGERLVLATDYMAPAGSGYRIEGGVVRAEDGTIAGSALVMDRAVRHLMSFASIPFERAIVNATAAPATLLGLERECGTLARGKRADLSIWNDRYEVLATIVGGEPVFGAGHLASTRVTSVG